MSTHIHEMHNDVSEVLFSEEQLKARVAELGDGYIRFVGEDK